MVHPHIAPLGPRLGWRIWHLFDGPDEVLRSPYVESRGQASIGVPWPRIRRDATCRSDWHPAGAPVPAESCRCGIYADPAYLLDSALMRMDLMDAGTQARALSDFDPFDHRPQVVIGLVKLYGRIVLDGSVYDPRLEMVRLEYRAERAFIRRLWVPSGSARAVDRLRAAYRARVVGGVPGWADTEGVSAEVDAGVGVYRHPSRMVVPQGAVSALVDQLKSIMEQQHSGESNE